jgi:probable RNA-binding protein EIF1AD
MGKPKRNVLAAAEETLTPPDALEPNQTLVRVVKPEGNNLYTCELPNNKTVLLELAQRFRNTIWIKRGGYVLGERYAQDSNDTRADGEIVNVVRDERLWRKQTYWYVNLSTAPRIHVVTDEEFMSRPKEFVKNPYDLSDSEDDSNVGKMPPSDSEED